MLKIYYLGRLLHTLTPIHRRETGRKWFWIASQLCFLKTSPRLYPFCVNLTVNSSAPGELCQFRRRAFCHDPLCRPGRIPLTSLSPSAVCSAWIIWHGWTAPFITTTARTRIGSTWPPPVLLWCSRETSTLMRGYPLNLSSRKRSSWRSTYSDYTTAPQPPVPMT